MPRGRQRLDSRSLVPPWRYSPGTSPFLFHFCFLPRLNVTAHRVGEKLLDSWDPEMPMDVLLQWLTLFWLTRSFPTSIYLYRHLATVGDFTIAPTQEEKADLKRPMRGLRIQGKPVGYSTFPREIFPVPRAWAELTGDLVFYRLNEKGESVRRVLGGCVADCYEGGHFAGCENPELLAKDFVDFLEVAWPMGTSKL